MWLIKIQLQVKLPINEDERGDAFRGIPKLRILVILEYLGVPWASPSLGSCHSLFHNPSNLYPKHENFTTQNLTENLVRSVSERKQNTTSRYCNELILYLYWCYTQCIPSFYMVYKLFYQAQIHQNKQTTHEKQNLSKTEQSVVICN